MKLKKALKGTRDIKGENRSITALKPIPKHVERLVSVAIQRGNDFHQGFKAHWELRNSLGDENPHNKTPGDIEGFWTSHERFVGRYEAADIGRASGQVSPRLGRELLSSDINW